MIHTTKAQYEFGSECSSPSCSRECILCYFCPPGFKWVCSSSAESKMLRSWEPSEVSSYLAQATGLSWSTELVHVVVGGWVYAERFTGFVSTGAPNLKRGQTSQERDGCLSPQQPLLTHDPAGGWAPGRTCPPRCAEKPRYWQRQSHQI